MPRDPAPYPPTPPGVAYPPPPPTGASVAASRAPTPGPLPLLHDPALLLVLAVALAGQLLAWSHIGGYRLADTVEYLERAYEVAQGRALDPSTMRSFAFSALFVPFFWLADLFGLEDLRIVVHAARGTQVLLGLTAVVVVARIGAQQFGRVGGLACGALLGFNPIFAQYSVTPLSATAALLFVALGLSGLARADDRALATGRRGLGTGLWFGASILMAFQCIPIVGALLAMVPLRRAWRAPRHLVGLATGVALALLLQAILDWWTFGTFASALRVYLLENAGYLIANLLRDVGLHDQAIAIYNEIDARNALGGIDQRTSVARSMTPRTWYLTNLTSLCLVVPATACAVVGLTRSLRRPSWITALCIVCFGVNLMLLSIKGSKSFRLWMPLLPMVAIVAGGGWAWLFATAPRLARARLAAGVALLSATAGLGWRIVLDTNLSKYAGYWQGIEIVNAHADPDGPEQVVGAAYHWASRFRVRPGVRLVKLREHLDRWGTLSPEERANAIEGLAELDWFVGHGQTLFQDPDLVRAANEHFEVHTIIDDREAFEELQPIYVLRRRTGDPGARTFYEVFEDTAEGQANWPPLYQARIQHPVSVRFRRTDPDGTVAELIFLGFDVDPSAVGGQQAWVTYHWYAGPLHGRRYEIVDSFSDRWGRYYPNNHEPGHGAIPTTEWREGTIVRESFLTRIAPDAERFGGAYRRGDLMPIDLWIAVSQLDEEGNQISGLNPHFPSVGSAVSRIGVEGGYVSQHGYRWSRHALLHVGGFWMPVIDERRVPDDGQPIAAAP